MGCCGGHRHHKTGESDSHNQGNEKNPMLWLALGLGVFLVAVIYFLG